MTYFVGAYAASPSANGWNAETETQYYTQLKKDARIKGLEHPFVGQLHIEDDEWFLDNISTEWEFVFTCIPGIMDAISKNPDFGIASDNEAGRQEALDFMLKARDAIAKLNAHCGKPVVKAIEIQTSPNREVSSSSAASLKTSLTTMQSWDWQGARIVIEHCDTFVEGQEPQKGFLTLQEELDTIAEVNESLDSNMGVVINWGRSVIETRSTQGALDHIEQAKAAGLLAGLMFSGVSDQETEYGAWKDSHMPAEKTEHSTIGADGSWMTQEEMHKCVDAADAKTLAILGIKLGVRPLDAPLTDRLAHIDNALSILESAK